MKKRITLRPEQNLNKMVMLFFIQFFLSLFLSFFLSVLQIGFYRAQVMCIRIHKIHCGCGRILNSHESRTESKNKEKKNNFEQNKNNNNNNNKCDEI